MHLWILLRNLPRLTLAQLVWPASLIGAWTLFGAAGAPAPMAFVWAAIFAQCVYHGRAMAYKVQRLAEIGDPGDRHAALLVIVPLVCAGLQIWGSDPWFSQRLLSIAIAFMISVKLIALVRGDFAFEGAAPRAKATPLHRAFDRHLLQLKVLIAVLAIAVNEGLMIVDAPLAVRIAVLAVLPLAAHYLLWFITFITHPTSAE